LHASRLSASTQELEGVSEFVKDRDALTESFSGAQKFVRLQADAIGRKPVACLLS
jgi:hypothetical protein